MNAKIKQGRVVRQEKVRNITERLQGVNGLIFSDYRGLTVSQITEVRRAIVKLGAKMYVQKNKLMKIALAQEGYPDSTYTFLQGPSAVAYVTGDVSPVLKELFKYSKASEYSFSVKGAFLDGEVMDKDLAEQISNLPSKDQLLGQLMGVMQAPVRNMAVGLNDVITRLARVLQAMSENK